MNEEDRALWDDLFLQRLVDFKVERGYELGKGYRPIIDKLLENGGRCPCKPRDSDDNACPCHTAEELVPGESCTCGLFLNKVNRAEACAAPIVEQLAKLEKEIEFSEPVSTSIIKLELAQRIRVDLRNVDIVSENIADFDSYSTEKLIMAANILTNANEMDFGLLYRYAAEHGEEGTKVLLDLIMNGLIQYEVKYVSGIDEMLRLRVMCTDEAIQQHVVKGKVSIIDFSAEWCEPCKMLGEVLDKLESEDVAITRIDIDKNKDLAKRYGIQGVPYFVIFNKEGSLTEAVCGFHDEKWLREAIEEAKA
jgi:thioredoxin 1